MLCVPVYCSNKSGQNEFLINKNIENNLHRL